jgi:hypothetical protein
MFKNITLSLKELNQYLNAQVTNHNSITQEDVLLIKYWVKNNKELGIFGRENIFKMDCENKNQIFTMQLLARAYCLHVIVNNHIDTCNNI